MCYRPAGLTRVRASLTTRRVVCRSLYMCTYIHTHTHMYEQTHIRNTNIHTHTCICTYIRKHTKQQSMEWRHSGLPCSKKSRVQGHFEGKTPREIHQGGLVLARRYPGSPAFATQNKLAYLGFHCLDHPPYSPDLAPPDYHLFPGLKNN